MAPKRFGNVRVLGSGRFQARYRPRGAPAITAPHTFDSEEEALAWLSDLEAEFLEAEEERASQWRHFREFLE